MSVPRRTSRPDPSGSAPVDGRPAEVAARADPLVVAGELRRSEELFRSLIQHSSDMILVVDPSGRLVYGSPSSMTVLGHDPVDLIGTSALELVHPDDAQAASEALTAAVGTPGVTPPVTFRARHASGAWRWMEAVANNLVDDPALRGLVINARDVTARVEAEAALRDAQDRLAEKNRALRALFDASPVALLALDTDARVTMWTRTAEKIFGWTEAEVLGRSLPFVDRDVEGHRAIVARTLGGATFSGEVTRRHKDGSTVEIDLSVAPVRDPDGRVTGVIAADVDVTGRKRTERELRMSMALLDTLQNSAPIGFGFLDRSLKVVRANETLIAISGKPLSEHLGRPIAEVAPDAWPQIGPALQRVLDTGESVLDMDVAGPSAADGGRVHEWLASFYPVRLDEEMIGIGIVAVDVTERNRASEARAHLAAIVESSDDAIVSASLEGTILSWNSGATALYGYEPGEIVGRAVAGLLPPDLAGAAEEILGAVATGKGVRHMEMPALRKDGSVVPVSLSASAVSHGDGIIAASIIAQDITDRRRLELERTVALESALRASRVKSQFIANTSHELRSPMTVILGMTDLLLDGDLEDGQRQLAEAIGRASRRLMGIIQTVLDFSTAAEGGLELERRDVEVRPLIEGVRRRMAGAAEAKGIELTFECDADVAHVASWDPTRVRQILMTLVSNALKFTETGTVRVRVCRPESAETEEVRFTVTDTGIGIGAAEQWRVFQPFWQADPSDSRAYEGAGMGLALAAELVDAMEGTIGVHSSPGRGSTFWFQIPTGLRPRPRLRST